MNQLPNTKPNTLYVIGLNYKKADAEMRGKFSLNLQAKNQLLTQARALGFNALMVISTCNRTELYGFAEHPFQLISLLCANSSGTIEDFEKVGYIHKNNDAVSHLFLVGTGMDSQILGDFEIISQVKSAFIDAKAFGLTNSYFERLVNAVIQASKRIKNETEISTGATSVAFASVHYLFQHWEDISNKKILLFGIGKIGRNTCDNLIKHAENTSITIINRTQEKANALAKKHRVETCEINELQAEISKTDVLIVATGANQPTVFADMLHLHKPLLILDLSIPQNVHPNVGENDLVKLVSLDTLSKMTDETLENRKKHIPTAQKIINDVKNDFLYWSMSRKFAPTITALKTRLEKIKQDELNYHKRKIHNFDEIQADLISSRIIQKITTHFATHLKNEPLTVDENIQWIEKVFQLETFKNE